MFWAAPEELIVHRTEGAGTPARFDWQVIPAAVLAAPQQAPTLLTATGGFARSVGGAAGGEAGSVHPPKAIAIRSEY